MLNYNFILKEPEENELLWPSRNVLPWVPSKNNDILLSYPRSGNTFVRYFLEYVTRRPTWGYSKMAIDETSLSPVGFQGTAMDFPIFFWCQKLFHYFKIDQQGHVLGKPIFKRHSVQRDKDSGEWLFSSEQDNLILLIRDPLECISRNLNLHKSLDSISLLDNEIEDFYHNLKVFDSWKGKKLLVYYENMVYKHQQFFTELSKFLDCDQFLLMHFLSNFENHKSISLSLYESTKEYEPSACGSVTKGRDISYYRKILDQKTIDFFEEKIKANDLYEKYLTKYDNE